MKFDLNIHVHHHGRGTAASAGPSPSAVEAARAAIRDGYAKATAEGATPAQAAEARKWFGGALRVYKELVGDDLDHLLTSLAAATPAPPVQSPAALIPGVSFRPIDVTNRPGPHPGAQRPVPREVIEAEEAERRAREASEDEEDHDVLHFDDDGEVDEELGASVD